MPLQDGSRRIVFGWLDPAIRIRQCPAQMPVDRLCLRLVQCKLMPTSATTTRFPDHDIMHNVRQSVSPIDET
jgi:hypothetical protein